MSNIKASRFSEDFRRPSPPVQRAACRCSPEAQGKAGALETREGRKLRVLRWKRFRPGRNEELWWRIRRNSARNRCRSTCRPTRAGEDVRPKAAVAANVGSGRPTSYRFFSLNFFVFAIHKLLRRPGRSASSAARAVFAPSRVSRAPPCPALSASSGTPLAAPAAMPAEIFRKSRRLMLLIDPPWL